MRIKEYISEPFSPTTAFEYLGGWLENIQNCMDALDRAYFAQALPDPEIWPEVSGSFHSLQMSLSWIVLAVDEFLTRLPEE